MTTILCVTFFATPLVAYTELGPVKKRPIGSIKYKAENIQKSE